MKKKCLVLVVLLNILIFITQSVSAEEYEFTGEGASVEWEKAWDAMKEKLPENLHDDMEDYLLSDIQSAENSKLVNGDYWWERIRCSFFDSFLPAVSDLSEIIGILLLTALCRHIPFPGSLNKAVQFCGNLCMTAVVCRICFSAVETGEIYIQSLCTIMTSMVPVMSAVSYASGEITAATVQNTSITLFLTVISNLNSIIIKPLLNVLMALTITGSVCTEISIGSFTGSVKKIMMTVFSFFLLIYSFVYGIQTSLARAADSLGLRTVRFALSNFIPIVGGPVSDAFSALRTGMGYVRTAAGAGGIGILILLVLPTGISIWLTCTMLSFGQTISEIIGSNDMGKLLGDVHSVMQILSALIWMTTVFFLFTIILFTKTSGQSA